MSDWRKYQRTNLAEMRPYVKNEDLSHVSVSAPDQEHLAVCLMRDRDPGGYIARNPENHEDQWYVGQAYFEQNFKEVEDGS